ncbi:MAG: U32 family peptidase [Deltaproteobacteria bacterium]|nr:U32 family peptidase [Deltaproteobacteria bacterium]
MTTSDLKITRKMELLAPGGGIDAIKAAILAGADAVYCGLEKFSARDRAKNVPIDDLPQVVYLAHQHDCQIFVTLNIILLESEFSSIVRILHRLSNMRLDGVIVQDIGLLYLIRTHFPGIRVHASTQLTTHNAGQLAFLATLSTVRVNLCRELNMEEIKDLTNISHQLGMETEVFVHGANCLSFSGLCYMSSVCYGNSGNRGRCSQPCREEYEPTPQGWRFPLNLKDNTAFMHVPQLRDAGVDSLKIEGRIKQSNYVYRVVRLWQQQLRRLYSDLKLCERVTPLRTVYNRDFTSGFLDGVIHKDMFIDNPKDNSARYFLKKSGAVRYKEIKQVNQIVNDSKKKLIEKVKKKVARLSVAKVPLEIHVSGKEGAPLCMTVNTSLESFNVLSDTTLFRSQRTASDDGSPVPKAHNQLNKKLFLHKLRAINGTAYQITDVNMSRLDTGLCIGYEEIVRLKEKILYRLNGSLSSVAPVELPEIQRANDQEVTPQLSVLICDASDLFLSDETDANFYFELPNQLAPNWESYAALFKKWPMVTPWFPEILIGDDFAAAVALLRTVRPTHIVTNNSGLAQMAFEMRIPWTAGPYMNIANSFALECLKRDFNCNGAFLSNELNHLQLKSIPRVADMALHYSIFHPIPLMTSRQCLFHQVTGCEKSEVSSQCIAECSKSASIVNMKGVSILVEKREGDYHRLYFDRHYLNTSVALEMPNVFSSYLVDLKRIPTRTRIAKSQRELILLFEQHIHGSATATEQLHQSILATTCNQFAVGI